MEIIWDWNGTLFDDVSTGLQIVNQMLISRNKPPLNGIEHYRKIFQFPVENYYREAGMDFTRESFERMAADYIALYPVVSKSCGLMKDAQKVLSAFQQAGFRQNILSASEQGLLERQLDQFGIQQYFSSIIGQKDPYGIGKIQRGILWLQQNKIPPKNCLLIGDTDHDAQTAQALGCPCMLLACGHQSRERLNKTGVPVFDSLSEAAEAVLCGFQ